MQQSRIFVGMVLILIFAEVLGLYGQVSCWKAMLANLLTRCPRLIVALLLNTHAQG
jgi:hypothetical protein